MKIYYTTSKIHENDTSYYGIFAQDGDRFYHLTAAGLWREATRPSQIEYYKTCDKIDLEEYVKNMDEPQTIKLFQRTEGVKRPDPINEKSEVDNSFVGYTTPVVCQLPDGTFLCLNEKDPVFQRMLSKKVSPLRTISPSFTEDGKYTLTETKTAIVPKDVVEDLAVILEESVYGSENQI